MCNFFFFNYTLNQCKTKWLQSPASFWFPCANNFYMVYIIFFIFRLPLEMLEKLSPYFKVDYYLPRSFITAVKMEYVPEILTTGLIPSDVVLALLCYYLRTTCIMTKDSRDVSYEYLSLHLHKWYLKNYMQRYEGQPQIKLQILN